MQIARGLHVPVQADSVESPEVRFGDRRTDLLVWLDEPGSRGRVTFEGFDAIRVCRGEYLPYPDDWTPDAGGRCPWVYEVDNSRWLRERHGYEMRHYRTPLLEEYVHYLFHFHDEYVELIAKGIWIEKVANERVDEPPAEHPLYDLSKTLPGESFVVDRIACVVRHNPLPASELLERSRLCSQSLFQYFMTLDGGTSPSYAARLRTLRGRSVTRLRGGLFYPDQITADGVGDERRFRPAFEQYMREVAQRRREMGKSSS
jgi:hypothetical protein